jgi:hypothetical protein
MFDLVCWDDLTVFPFVHPRNGFKIPKSLNVVNVDGFTKDFVEYFRRPRSNLVEYLRRYTTIFVFVQIVEIGLNI